jgi:hypothetical protein
MQRIMDATQKEDSADPVNVHIMTSNGKPRQLSYLLVTNPDLDRLIEPKQMYGAAFVAR